MTFAAASFRASGVGNSIHGIRTLGELGVFPITPNLRVQKSGHSQNWVIALAPPVTFAAPFFVQFFLWEANSLNPNLQELSACPATQSWRVLKNGYRQI